MVTWRFQTAPAWAKEVGKYAKLLVLFEGANTTATLRMREALAIGRVKVPTQAAGGMAEAVRLASAAARRGDVVLLSPGCASFGLFQHEFDRGERFVREVKRLAKREPKGVAAKRTRKQSGH
jgi:UDP-N-acetylmuramoylalanine--D-glutamate ligase